MFATEPPLPRDAPGLIDATRRFLMPTLALTLAGLVLGVMFTVGSSDVSTAEGLLTLTDPRGNAVFETGNTIQVDLARYAQDRADFAGSSQVLEQAAAALDEPLTVVDLRSACSAEVSANSNVLRITCEFDSEKLALQTVDAIAEAYRQQTKAQTDADAATALATLETERSSIETQVEEIRASGLPDDQISIAIAASIGDRLTSVEERATDIRTTAALFGDGTEFYDPAGIADSASGSVTLARNSLIGMLIGALAAVTIAWFRADRAPVLERGDEVADALGLLMLGEIRRSRADSTVLDVFESPDQEYQLLASNLDAVLAGGLALFSSPAAIANHAEIVISVALVASHSGKRVLLIDADTRNRSISSALGTSHAAGFCDMLTGESSPEQVTARIALAGSPGLDAAELFLMGPGTAPSDVAALFRAKRSHEALEYLTERYDLVIVDAPPMLSSADTASLARAGGGMVLMVEAGTSKAAIENARRQLSFVAAQGIGFVLVDDGRG